MYNNPSVNLATGVAYVDGRMGEGWAAGADRWRAQNKLQALAKGEWAARSVFFVNDDENDAENDENILNYRRRD